MRLVNEIVELLSSQEPSLQTALLKAQVLAHRLGEAELQQWVDWELKGYPDSATLPEYRILRVTVMGNISNVAYRHTSQPLPLMKLDERLRERLETSRLTQSIAVLESCAKDESKLSIVIQPEFYHYLQKGLASGYEVERAWGQPAVGAILQAVVEVRSRLLDFALKLSDKFPSDKDPGDMKQAAREASVGDIFRNAVFGDNATVVIGSGSIQGVTNSVIRNDVESLLAALKKTGIEEADLAALRAAISDDAGSPDHAERKFGPRVRSWIGRMMSKAGTSTWQIAVAAAGNVLGNAISAFYGFGA